MILLLGKTGQVGCELHKLVDGLRPITAPTSEELDLKDLNSLEEYLALVKPNLIINAAGYTQVDRAEAEFKEAFILNTEIPAMLAQYCAKNDAYLLHYSTDYVYAGEGDEKQVETSPTHPLSVYARTKLAGDEAILATGCKSCILRTSWVYSPRRQNFVKTMLHLAKARDSIRVVNDQVGAPTSASAIAAISREIVLRKLTGVFNICCAGETSWFGLAREALQYSMKLGLIDRLPHIEAVLTSEYATAAQRPLNSRLDCRKLENVLSISLPSWESELRRTLEIMTSP